MLIQILGLTMVYVLKMWLFDEFWLKSRWPTGLAPNNKMLSRLSSPHTAVTAFNPTDSVLISFALVTLNKHSL